MLAKFSEHEPSSYMDDVQVTPSLAVNRIEGYVQVPENYQLDIEPFNNALHNTENFDWVSGRFSYNL
jgi:hypothetical protein